MKFSDARNVHVQDLLLEWQRQTWWKWAGQMSSQVDRDRYWETVSHALRKYFNQDSMVRTKYLAMSPILPLLQHSVELLVIPSHYRCTSEMRTQVESPIKDTTKEEKPLNKGQSKSTFFIDKRLDPKCVRFHFNDLS